MRPAPAVARQAAPTSAAAARQPSPGASRQHAPAAANGRTLSRRPRTGAQPASKPVTAPSPTADLAAAAAAAGAEIQTGGDFLEISFPPPAGVSQPSTSMSPTGPAIARMPTASEATGLYRESAAAARQLGGGATLARAASGSSSSSSSGGSSGDAVVGAVLRAMREENEHLGILDGIDPLY